MQNLSVRECVRFGWETFKKRPWLFIGAVALIAVVQIALQLISNVDVVGPILATVVGILVGMGIVRFALHAHTSVETVTIKDLWTPHPFWRYVGATLLRGAISSGPLLIVIAIWFTRLAFLATPKEQFSFGPLDILFGILALAAFVWAIYMGIRLSFAEYIVMDKGSLPVPAVKESFHSTKAVWGKLFLLSLAIAGLNILGALALVVGLFVSVPVSLLAFVHAYRTVIGNRAPEVAAVSL